MTAPHTIACKTTKIIKELKVEKKWKKVFEESLKENDEALRILAKL